MSELLFRTDKRTGEISIVHRDERTQKIQEALNRQFPLRISELRGAMKLFWLDYTFWRSELRNAQDILRQTRIARVNRVVTADKRAALSDLWRRCQTACREIGCSYLDHSDEFVWATNDKLDDDNCFRFAYKVDGDGKVVLDSASRQVVAWPKSERARDVRSDRELRMRMRNAAGITSR